MIAKLPRLTADELRAALARLGITQAAFAELLDVNDRTVRSWLSKRRPIPAYVSYAIFYAISDDTPQAGRHPAGS